jgi:hypothetical protein
MTTFQLSLVFFIIGIVEFYIDTWERLVSSRLKFFSTILYSTLNHAIDFFMYVFLFGVLIQFWETWYAGVHDYYKLIPYIFYTIGKIVGVDSATWWYAQCKKRQDKVRAITILNTKHKKKKGKKIKNKKNARSVEVSNLFDSVETEDLKQEIKDKVVENVTQQITDKVDEALNQENNS